MAIQSELLNRADLPISLRLSGVRDQIKTPEDYNQVLDTLLKGSLADPQYYQQQYSQANSGSAPPAAGGMGDRAYMDREAANYKNYVQNQLKDLGIDRPQPSPLEEGRNPKPATPQPAQEPLNPSFSYIEVATPKETKSDSPLLEDIPDLGLEQMPSLLQDDARPADPASKLTPPESYLSDYVANLGKGETPPNETQVAGPGYIDEDDAFDNPYYTDPVPDLDDDSDFPDLGDLDLAQATQSNFQKLLNQVSQQEEVAASYPTTNTPLDKVGGFKGIPKGKGIYPMDKDGNLYNPQTGLPVKASTGNSEKPDIAQKISDFRDSLLAQAKNESPRTRRGPRGEKATFSPVERKRPDDKPFAQEEKRPVKEDTRQSFDVQEKRLARASEDDYRRKQADPIDPMRRGAIFG